MSIGISRFLISYLRVDKTCREKKKKNLYNFILFLLFYEVMNTLSKQWCAATVFDGVFFFWSLERCE